MKILYEAPNPFGKLNLDELEKFEQIINYRLPEDYRNYLLNFNGAKPINTVCNISDTEGETSLHDMLGIHDGPYFAKLEPVFGDNNITRENGLIAFANDQGGNYFCICLRPEHYGEIYFYDHEVSYDNKIENLVKLENSFIKFIECLVSKEEYERNLAETHPEFYKRLQSISIDPQT